MKKKLNLFSAFILYFVAQPIVFFDLINLTELKFQVLAVIILVINVNVFFIFRGLKEAVEKTVIIGKKSGNYWIPLIGTPGIFFYYFSFQQSPFVEFLWFNISISLLCLQVLIIYGKGIWFFLKYEKEHLKSSNQED